MLDNRLHAHTRTHRHKIRLIFGHHTNKQLNSEAVLLQWHASAKAARNPGSTQTEWFKEFKGGNSDVVKSGRPTHSTSCGTTVK